MPTAPGDFGGRSKAALAYRKWATIQDKIKDAGGKFNEAGLTQEEKVFWFDKKLRAKVGDWGEQHKLTPAQLSELRGKFGGAAVAEAREKMISVQADHRAVQGDTFYYDNPTRFKIVENLAKKFKKERDKKTPAKTFGAKKALAKEGKLAQTEQAFLLQNIEKILSLNQAPKAKDLPRLIVADTEDNLLNKLTSNKQRIEKFMSVTPKDLSSLTPYIRFFKKDIFSNQLRVREFKFASHSPNLIDYFRDGISAGSEVGLKSFNFETVGQTQYTASKNMVGEMVLFFKSFSDLGSKPAGANALWWTELLFPENFQAADNIVSPDEGLNYLHDVALERMRNESVLSPQRHAEILVEMGYHFSDNAIDAGLQEAARDSRMLLSLHPNTSDFNFKEDGSVELSISFTASAQSLSDTFTSNVLTVGTTEKDLDDIQHKRAQLAAKKKSLATASDGEDKDTKAIKKAIKKMEAAAQRVEKREIMDNVGRFIKYVYDQKRLFSLTISEAQYREGILSIPKGGLQSMGESAEQVIFAGAAQLKTGKSGLDPTPDKWGDRTIGYFYLGDLLNYMAWALVPFEQRAMITPDWVTDQNIPGGADAWNEQLATLPQVAEIIVGDYVFHIFPPENFSGDDDEWIKLVEPFRTNLTRLPISYSLFNVFMYNNVIKGKASMWTFHEFLQKAVSELIGGALDTYVAGRKYAETKAGFSQVSATALQVGYVSGHGSDLIDARKGGHLINFDIYGGTDVTPGFDLRIRPPTMDALLTGDITPSELPTNFIIVHGSRLDPTKEAGKDEIEDANQGIWHLGMGSSRGIVKNISFKQTASALKDINLLKHLKHGGVVDASILQMPYNADVKIFGNPSFYPGQFVFLNPTMVGVGDINSQRSIARQLGLGGLYMISKVSTTLAAGSLESTLVCIQNNMSHSTKPTHPTFESPPEPNVEEKS